MKANFNLNEIITSSLWQEMVTENLHVFKGCAEAIDDISQTILNDYNNRKMLSKDTRWYFIANFNNAVTKRDVNPNDISYPIKIEYHPYPVFNTIMSVLDRKDHPTEIIISVDVVNFSQVLYDMYNQNCTDDEVYQYVHSKVSHEFGHIRENYGLAWITDFKNKMMNIIDVSQTKRYVTSNINKFFKFPDTTQDKQLELDDVYNVIKHIMYMFSPTEMNQRIRETYDFINLYSNDEIQIISNSIDNVEFKKYKLVARYFEMTQRIHFYNQMEEIFKTISSSNKTSTDFKHTLLLAFYFKYYNIYKTEDKLSKNLIEHIWTVDELTADEIRRYKKYHNHFSFFLRSALDKYKHKLFSVIFSLLHKRLWEEFELKFFNQSLFEQQTNFKYKDVITLLESTTETVF